MLFFENEEFLFNLLIVVRGATALQKELLVGDKKVFLDPLVLLFALA